MTVQFVQKGLVKDSRCQSRVTPLRIVVLGSLPIASKVCELLLARQDVHVEAAIVCAFGVNVDPWPIEPLARFAVRNNIPILSIDDVIKRYPDQSLDFAFTVRFGRILKSPFISKFRRGIINFHGGLLPEFGGLYSSCHVLLQNAKMAGGTLHYIRDEGIDKGEIIKRAEFRVCDTDTSQTIFIKTQKILFSAFEETVDSILREEVSPIPQGKIMSESFPKRYYEKSSLNKCIDWEDPISLSRKARGMEFVAQERANITVGSTKIYLTTRPLHLLERAHLLPTTPIESIFRPDIDLRCKRDDAFPFYAGGNKARKISFIGDHVVASGYNCIVTNGGMQSNHARATALWCAQNGIKCSLVLHTNVDAPSRDSSGNHLVMKRSGADIRYCNLNDLSDEMEQVVKDLRLKGHKPFYLWGGGHCLQGSISYYKAAQEAQFQCDDWVPDYVIVASGTGTTQAGLVAGYMHLPTRVVGVSIARERVRGASVVEESLKELCCYLKIEADVTRIHFREEWSEGGYEQVSQRLLECVNTCIKKGMVLDPTYTGKAFLALEDMVASGEIPRGSRVLFWHTGGLINLLSSPHFVS